MIFLWRSVFVYLAIYFLAWCVWDTEGALVAVFITLALNAPSLFRS